jgi:hypothetical protein
LDLQRQTEQLRTLAQHIGVGHYHPRNGNLFLALGVLNYQVRANARWFTWGDS